MCFTKYFFFYTFGNNLRTKHRPYIFEFSLYSGVVEDFVLWDMTLRHWEVVSDICKECRSFVLQCRVLRASVM